MIGNGGGMEEDGRQSDAHDLAINTKLAQYPNFDSGTAIAETKIVYCRRV